MWCQFGGMIQWLRRLPRQNRSFVTKWNKDKGPSWIIQVGIQLRMTTFVLRVFERKSCGTSTCSTIWYPYCVEQILGPPARGQWALQRSAGTFSQQTLTSYILIHPHPSSQSFGPVQALGKKSGPESGEPIQCIRLFRGTVTCQLSLWSQSLFLAILTLGLSAATSSLTRYQACSMFHSAAFSEHGSLKRSCKLSMWLWTLSLPPPYSELSRAGSYW